MIRSILSTDLPQLEPAKLDEVTTFVEQRIAQLVGPAGTAVRIVRAVMSVLLAPPWRGVTQPFLTRSALPALGDFVRLVRSLGYAYIWEHWPDTMPSGATR